jgi:CrcB protein
VREALWVGVGGFVGAVTRYLLGGWVTARLGPGFPYGTFAINVTGSFVLGTIMGALEGHIVAPVIRLAAAVGFVGAYTTFSTFTYETLRLLEEGSFLLAAANVGGSVLTGLVFGALGLVTGRGI